mmetsp:Transcript_28481/g.75394  ORF Transcript_28481/g.75394 Transcript_28481/m.75394 type:complete len:309 (+) Transcript_28481:2968-3894(+)
MDLLDAAVLVREEALEGDGFLQRHQLLGRQQLGVQVVVEVADLLQLHGEAVELQAVLHRRLHLAGDAAPHLLEEARLLHELDQALGVGDLEGALLGGVELHHAAVHLQGDGVVGAVQVRVHLVLPLLEAARAQLLQILPHLLADGADLPRPLKVLEEAAQRAGCELRFAPHVLDPHHLTDVHAETAARGQVCLVEGLQLVHHSLQELAQLREQALALVRERLADVLPLEEVLIALEYPHRLRRVGGLGDEFRAKALRNLGLHGRHVGLVLGQGGLPERNGVLVVAEDVELREGLEDGLDVHHPELLLG